MDQYERKTVTAPYLKKDRTKCNKKVTFNKQPKLSHKGLTHKLKPTNKK